MSFAKTKLGKIFYQISGPSHGTPMVLVRGLGRWSEHWDGFEKRLAEEFRVITFDSRGLGKTTAPLLPWHTMKDLATDIAIILRTERIESAHIVGVSLGGMMALEFGAMYPELTKSVTAVNASVGRSGHRRITSEALKFLLRAPHLGAAVYPTLIGLLTAPTLDEARRKDLSEAWAKIDGQYALPVASVMQQLMIAMRWRNLPDVAGRIKCPIQIISADQDQFVPRGNSLFLAKRLPNATLVRFENCGHEPHMDQPELFQKTIAVFVNQVEGSAYLVKPQTRSSQ